MENEIIKNTSFYRFSEKSIKKLNSVLWSKINEHNSENISFKEKFYLYENSIESKPKCYCGSDLKFIDMCNGFRNFCSKKCMYGSEEVKEKRKETSTLNWGVDNPSKSVAIKNKVKQTNNLLYGVDYPLQSTDVLNKSKEIFIEKYGVDNPSKLKEVREKAEKTMLDKFGVSHAMQSSEIKEELKEFFIEKYGVDNPSKLKEVREKAEKTMLDKWGVRYALQNKNLLDKAQLTNFIKYGEKSYRLTENYQEIIKKKIFEKNSTMVNTDKYTLIHTSIGEYTIFCSDCKSEFTIQRQLWRNRIKENKEICLNCAPINNGISVDEKKIVSYVRSIYSGEIIENYKVDKKEIDIYLPKLKIGIEYNGLYWHSELNKNKNYHYNKMKFFNDLGISLLQIWEDDWTYKNDIVKSIIKNKIGQSERIFARNCDIKELYDQKLVKDFLVKNHIQGFVGSSIKIGLFYKNELVSLMTLGNLRKPLGQKSKNYSYELLRFCNKINFTVVGGASKLFNFFLKKYAVNEVVSYSLNNYSTGNLYKKLNFTFGGETSVNYHWCKNGIRYHRFNFRKDKLVKEGFDKTKTEVEMIVSRFVL